MMTAQIAAFLTTWSGDAQSGYSVTFTPQANEYYASNLLDLLRVLNSANIANLPDANLVDKHNVVAAGQDLSNGIGIVYVYADSTRVITADANANYLAWWTYTLDRQAVEVASEKHPLSDPLAIELTNLETYLTTNTGKSSSAIAAFLRGQFNVASNAELQTWFLTHDRKSALNKLAIVFASQEQQNA